MTNKVLPVGIFRQLLKPDFTRLQPQELLEVRKSLAGYDEFSVTRHNDPLTLQHLLSTQFYNWLPVDTVKSKQPSTKSWGLWNTLALKCLR